MSNQQVIYTSIHTILVHTSSLWFCQNNKHRKCIPQERNIMELFIINYTNKQISGRTDMRSQRRCMYKNCILCFYHVRNCYSLLKTVVWVHLYIVSWYRPSCIRSSQTKDYLLAVPLLFAYRSSMIFEQILHYIQSSKNITLCNSVKIISIENVFLKKEISWSCL
jgi:hypothetical protein